MATAPSSEAEASEIRRQGRRRLLGAVTLVMALVVFVPMILDNEPRPPRNEPALAIPPKDNIAPLPAPAPSSSRAPDAAASSRAPQGGTGPGPNASAVAANPPSATAANAPESAPKAATVTPTAPAPKTPQTASTPAAKPSPEKVAAAPKLEGFAVQVGAFKDEERLKQARTKLEAAGLTHYTERIEASGGPITRLRAGPFATREAAEAARAKLQAASLSGQVVALP